ncbi:hypothetical protein GCM10020369_08760 [Cryptosporangium minutisporangium]|uniref:Uncharacterized protein n=1 Tax=Cryptosporangium minutisporangium TaxID=113569 RepID=A0ABP6SSC2_9ACTN
MPPPAQRAAGSGRQVSRAPQARAFLLNSAETRHGCAAPPRGQLAWASAATDSDHYTVRVETGSLYSTSGSSRGTAGCLPRWATSNGIKTNQAGIDLIDPWTVTPVELCPRPTRPSELSRGAMTLGLAIGWR